MPKYFSTFLCCAYFAPQPGAKLAASGEWQEASGRRKVASGRRQVAGGKWQGASGKATEPSGKKAAKINFK